jgi:hypothetical protein
VHTVETLILALLINIMEIPEHLYGRNVRTRIVDDPFAPVFDEIFEKLKGLLDLTWWVFLYRIYMNKLCIFASIVEPLFP